MSKYSFYAVQEGNVPGIYLTWAECEAQIKGFSGAKFKGCTSYEDALKFVKGEEQSQPIKSGYINYDAVIYSDGSFNSKTGVYGGGWIVLQNDLVIGRGIIHGDKPEIAKERNNAGELSAVMKAVAYAASKGARKILIIHDYAGVGNFVTGSWKAKSYCSQRYLEWMTAAKNMGLTFDFQWVQAHAGNKYNELADEMARKAVGIAGA